MTSKRLVPLAAAVLVVLPAMASAWQRSIAPNVNGLALDGSGDVVTTGGSISGGGAEEVFVVRKFSGANGTPLWMQRFQGTVATVNIGNAGLAVVTTATDDVVAAGVLHDEGAGGDFAVVKLDGATGSPVWQTAIDGAFDDGYVLSLDGALALALDGGGDVLAAGGLADVVGSPAAAFVVVKLDGATGAELWRASLGGNGYADSVAVDANGDVVAAGVRGGGPAADLAVAKFSGIDGTELWRVTVDGSAHAADQANGLAIDPNGDVAVVGYLDDAATGLDLFVAKLSGADGSELWRREIDGSGSMPPSFSDADGAYSVAVDAAGDLVIGGSMANATHDFTVLKLAGLDGSDVWQYAIGGPGQDGAYAVAVDPIGDVLAAGSGDQHFTLVKLEGTTGAERWVQVITDPSGNGANHVAVDALGNAVAAGSLSGQSLVVKRAEALAGRALLVKDPGAAGSEVVKLASTDKGVLAPPSGTTGDPTAADSLLEIRNPVTAETASVALPAVGWSATSTGYRYLDAAGASGPCRKVVVRAGRGVKASCKGAGIGFSLDEATQQALMATLTLGGGPRYCMRFGGTIVRDAGDPMTGGSFIAKNAPPSAACVGP